MDGHGVEPGDSPSGMQAFWSANYHKLENPGWGVQFFARRLAPVVRGKKVLDLGCGAGHLSCLLAEAGASVTGVDFVPELLALAERRAGDGPQRPHFVTQDILKLDLPDSYDCICGVAVLHEIPSASYPELLQGLKRHLNPGGFCLFQENSFFNPFYRFLRRNMVGRAGIPKVGSRDETPFDQERWDIVKACFPYAARVCDVFVLFDRVWYQFMNARVARVSPRAARVVGDFCARADQFVSTRIGHRKVTLYWSWLQSIYFSSSAPHDAVFSAAQRPGPRR